jgi:hypothetical protein
MRISKGVISGAKTSPFRCSILFAIKKARVKPENRFIFLKATARYTPKIRTRSPGFATSVKSSSKETSIDLGAQQHYRQASKLLKK